MITKRVLIISNNAFCDKSSNGRTLMNFFGVEDSPQLAQFFIQADMPNFERASSFFRAGDVEVVRAFFKRRSAGKQVCVCYDETNGHTVNVTSRGRKIPRNSLFMLLRNFFWNRKGWRRDFYAWADTFSPQCVLLQGGDSPFMYDLALCLKKRYGANLFIYNSEDYYFKSYNYLRDRGVFRIFYPLFKKKLNSAIKRAVLASNKCIYNSEDLMRLYDEEFHMSSEYVYTSTEMKKADDASAAPVFSYLGNLGLNRHIGLIEIANALQKIDPTYRLCVYGKIPNSTVKEGFERCSAIKYMGFVGYDEVRTVMSSSRLLFHTESFEPFYVKDISHGFSTKIADNLASGVCFVLYAPAELTCSKYLRENDCALVISEPAELFTSLSDLLRHEDRQRHYIQNALLVAEKNHDMEKNKAKVQRIINS